MSHVVPVMYRTLSAIMEHTSSNQEDANDFSNMTYPSEIWETKSDLEVAVKSIILILIVLFGVLANVAILAAICNRHHLISPINFFFVNMAVADVATLVISPSMVLCRSIFQNYQLGSVGCKVEGFFEFSFLLIDVFNLMAITFARLLAIAIPHQPGLTTQRAVYLVVSSWAFGFALTSPVLIFRTYKERQWSNYLEKFCIEDVDILPLYWNVLVAIGVWIPLCIMLLSYSIIFWNIEKLEASALQREHQRSVNFKKRAAIIILTLVIVFILCRVPFTAVTFWRSILLIDPKPNSFGADFEILWFTANVLLFVNTALNPILYGLTNRNFRASLEQSKLSRWIFIMRKRRPEGTNNVWTVPKLVPRRVTEISQ